MKVLVTGARGMLGAATADALAARGDDVTVLQRRPSGLPHREVLADIADADAVAEAVAGHEAVLHLAARVGLVGTWLEFARANITGTRTLLDACRARGVRRFVHVSSPSVAHSGTALVGAPAGPADPQRACGHYARSKAAAEQLALTATADPAYPAVVAVRPHLVWGPGDPQLVGRVVERARARRLFVVGSGASLIDTTYVTNAADALLAALDRCDEARGQALVVSNGEPRPVAELLATICRAASVSPPRRAIPSAVARGAGAAGEAVWAAVPALRRYGDPPMTRFLAEQVSTAHWFDQRATRRLLRWAPRVDLVAGFAALARSYQGTDLATSA